MQTINRLEFLPNEILIECFEYLNAIDIFYSFDFLNSRFYSLIRNIPLHLNIEHIKESTLVQFCIEMSLNPQMKTQLRSLKLSKKNMCDAIQTLFSFVSLNELSQLRSLTLDDLNHEALSQISCMLPLLTDLRYVRLPNCYRFERILNSFPTSRIQTLSIQRLPKKLVLAHSFTSLVNLNIESCNVVNLCHFFKYFPKLRYLSIERIDSRTWRTTDKVVLLHDHPVHLQRLLIHSFDDEFDSLETLLQRTPNLKLLMVSNYYDPDIVDASRWQRLITTSLPLLDVFKFKFSVRLQYDDNDIVDKFQQFRSDFWHQQHHWYTEYVLDKGRGLIYTVPYMSNKYAIRPYATRFFDGSINHVNTFANVTDLTLCPEAMIDSSEFHFPNVNSLELANDDDDHDGHAYPFFKKKHIQCLKTIVNLCNITHLDISMGCRLKSSSVLLHLLQEMPYLSSLKSTKNSLFSLLNNSALSECFKKMIKKLDIANEDFYPVLKFNEIIKLCETFSTMEEFRCDVDRPEDLLLILNQLSKLAHIKVFSYKTRHWETKSYWLKSNVSESKLYSFTIKYETYEYDSDYYHSDSDDYYHSDSDDDW